MLKIKYLLLCGCREGSKGSHIYWMLLLDDRIINETGMLKYQLVIQKCLHTIELCWVLNAVSLITIFIEQISSCTVGSNAE